MEYRRRANHHTSISSAARSATPPRTPPTMAPVGVDFDDDVELAIAEDGAVVGLVADGDVGDAKHCRTHGGIPAGIEAPEGHEVAFGPKGGPRPPPKGPPCVIWEQSPLVGNGAVVPVLDEGVAESDRLELARKAGDGCEPFVTYKESRTRGA